MSKEILMTAEGLEKLKAELEELTLVRRKEVSEKIKIARGFGDLSENAEYDEAKNEQAQVEARIAQLENMLKNAKIVSNDDADSSGINVGSTVKIYDVEFDEEATYTIVGPNEADPEQDKISYESPIGKALVGHSAGDEVDVTLPNNNTMKIKILDIIRK